MSECAVWFLTFDAKQSMALLKPTAGVSLVHQFIFRFLRSVIPFIPSFDRFINYSFLRLESVRVSNEKFVNPLRTVVDLGGGQDDLWS